MRRYSSFVVRRWRLDGMRERVDVEHLQSGRRATVESLDQALRWLAETDAEDEGGERDSMQSGDERAVERMQ